MKLSSVLFWTATLAAGACRGPAAGTEATDLTELSRLESVWNKAHVDGDTEALNRLWADELSVAVPSMGRMTKPQLMGFWRSGRSTISRYETSGVQTNVYGDAAVATGRLVRVRDFNGQEVLDDWLFTKVYVRRAGEWRVVAWQASEAPKE